MKSTHATTVALALSFCISIACSDASDASVENVANASSAETGPGVGPAPPKPTPCDAAGDFAEGSPGATYCRDNADCVIAVPDASSPTSTFLTDAEDALGLPRGSAQCTKRNIKRPPTCPEAPGTTSAPDPKAVALPVFGPDGEYLRCEVRIECDAFTKTFPLRTRGPAYESALAHEVCHCAQFKRGSRVSETGADSCACLLLKVHGLELPPHCLPQPATPDATQNNAAPGNDGSFPQSE